MYQFLHSAASKCKTSPQSKQVQLLIIVFVAPASLLAPPAEAALFWWQNNGAARGGGKWNFSLKWTLSWSGSELEWFTSARLPLCKPIMMEPADCLPLGHCLFVRCGLSLIVSEPTAWGSFLSNSKKMSRHSLGPLNSLTLSRVCLS